MEYVATGKYLKEVFSLLSPSLFISCRYTAPLWLFLAIKYCCKLCTLFCFLHTFYLFVAAFSICHSLNVAFSVFVTGGKTKMLVFNQSKQSNVRKICDVPFSCDTIYWNKPNAIQVFIKWLDQSLLVGCIIVGQLLYHFDQSTSQPI